jgi:hypothetical protein
MGLSFNTIDGDMPDRNQNILEKKLMVILSNISALITIGIFKNYKTEVAANMAFDYKFSKEGEGEYNGKFTVGYSGRLKE